MTVFACNAHLRRMVWLIPVMALVACATPPTRTAAPEGGNPHYKVGQPYKIGGRWYVPKVERDYDEKGVASWYGDAFDGKLTANGEIFDKRRLSAAHKTLPLPTLVEVENLENGRKVVVRVNDRGPFVDDRLIDLSHAAADHLGFTQKGLARVRVRYLNEADVNAFAALPGGAKIAAADRGRTQTVHKPAPAVVAPVLTETQAAAATDADPIARLIASEAALQTKPGFALPADMWVEVASIENLNQLESIKLDLPDLGPISIHSDGDGESARRSLRAGPYQDEQVALALLTRVQAAGFGAARIVRGFGG